MSSPDPVVPGNIPSPKRADLVGVVMYLFAAFLFALNGSVVKTIIEAGIDPVHVTSFRNAGAMIVLGIFMLFRHRSGFRITKREIPFLITYGFVAFALVQFLYVFTISRLNVGIGTLLAFLAPVVVAIWLRFGKKQSVSSRVWIALVLTLCGLALVAEVWRGIVLDTAGLLAGIATALSLALYWLLGEAGQAKRDALSLTFWGFFFATIAWTVVAPWWSFPWDLVISTAPPLAGITLPVWALLAWMVLMGTIAPFLLVLGSLRRIGSQRAGIVGSTEPVWATVIAFVLLGETLTGIQAIGGLVVLAGILIAETSRRTSSSNSSNDVELGPEATGGKSVDTEHR